MAPDVQYLKDYLAPAYSVLQTDLTFDIQAQHTKVQARLLIQAMRSDGALILDGSAELISL